MLLLSIVLFSTESKVKESGCVHRICIEEKDLLEKGIYNVTAQIGIFFLRIEKRGRRREEEKEKK